MGIAADKLPRLFEMFYQVDASLERAHGGLGIGLSLVRRLVESHGGSVEARSDGPGQGSEFTVRLPVLVEAPRAALLPLPSVELDTARLAPRRILVVDDNRDAADMLATFLRLMGHDVRTAYDGVEGVEAAELFRPDAILLDIGMPRLNGEDVCRHIRSMRVGSRHPVDCRDWLGPGRDPPAHRAGRIRRAPGQAGGSQRGADAPGHRTATGAPL